MGPPKDAFVTGPQLQRLATFAALALVAYIGYGIYRAGSDDAPPKGTSTDIVFRNGTVVGQRIKTRSWSATYDRLVSNADQTVLDVDNVHDGTIFRKGKPYLHVRAAHMSVNTTTRDFNVSGPLHVETIGGTLRRSFDTTAAQWTDSEQRLSLPNHVLIHSGSAHPLSVGSLTFNVRTGDIAFRQVAGQVRFK